jgi:hypothetical protein
MILAILFGIWLIVAVVTFAMQFDPDDWAIDIVLALVWPLVFFVALALAISGATTEAYSRMRKALRPHHD